MVPGSAAGEGWRSEFKGQGQAGEWTGSRVALMSSLLFSVVLEWRGVKALEGVRIARRDLQ